MAGRGGGYDRYTDTGKPFNADGPSGDLQAPSGLGDLMSPSTGRAMPSSSNPADFSSKVAENHAYLTDPNTRTQMFHMATALMGGHSPLEALGLSMEMGLNDTVKQQQLGLEEKRYELDKAKTLQELQIGKIDLASKARDLLTQDRIDNARAAILGDPNAMANLGKMAPTTLLDTAGKLSLLGDKETAGTLIQMAGAQPEMMTLYDAAKADGSFTGGLADFIFARSRAGAPAMTNTVNGQKIPDTLMKYAVDSTTAADELDKQIRDLSQLKEVAAQTTTGALEPYKLPIKAAMLSMGIDIGPDQEQNVNMQQIFQKYSGQLALRFRNPDSGYGLTGNTSNQDLKFLMSIVPELGKTEYANKAVILGMLARQKLDSYLAREKSKFIIDTGKLPTTGDIQAMVDNAPKHSFLAPEDEAWINAVYHPDHAMPGQSDQVPNSNKPDRSTWTAIPKVKSN